MALDILDLLVVQKAGGGELRKTTVQDLLANADGGGAEVLIQDDAPALASYDAGTLWWCSADGRLYIKYVDADGEPGQWVATTPEGGGGIPDDWSVFDPLPDTP